MRSTGNIRGAVRRRKRSSANCHQLSGTLLGFLSRRPLRNLTDWFPAKYRRRRLTRHLVHEPVLVAGNQLQASAKPLDFGF
jgi:hypothetical protein